MSAAATATAAPPPRGARRGRRSRPYRGGGDPGRECPRLPGPSFPPASKRPPSPKCARCSRSSSWACATSKSTTSGTETSATPRRGASCRPSSTSCAPRRWASGGRPVVTVLRHARYIRVLPILNGCAGGAPKSRLRSRGQPPPSLAAPRSTPASTSSSCWAALRAAFLPGDANGCTAQVRALRHQDRVRALAGRGRVDCRGDRPPKAHQGRRRQRPPLRGAILRGSPSCTLS